MSYKRRTGNWLEAFLDANMPISESPQSMLFFSGLFALSSALRRHVCIGRGYLGKYEIHPHMFICFIAPPGVARKSTTAGIAEDMLRQITGPVKSPTNITLQALVKELTESPDTSLYIVASELSTMVHKSGPEVFDTLTDLFDGKKEIDDVTLTRGKVFGTNPVINFIACTTPVSVNNGSIPTHILAGGFGSRTLFIYETEPRQRVMYYNKIVNVASLDALQEDLVADLEHIANDLHGEFKIEDDAWEFMKQYYEQSKISQSGEAKKIDGYFSRKHIHIHKLAMLLHIAYSDELVLTLDDMVQAVNVLATIEPKMLAAFRSLGKNRYTGDMEGILAFIQEKKRVPRTELLSEFAASAEPARLEELIMGLRSAGKISVEQVEGVSIYFALPVLKS